MQMPSRSCFDVCTLEKLQLNGLFGCMFVYETNDTLVCAAVVPQQVPPMAGGSCFPRKVWIRAGQCEASVEPRWSLSE